jgi:hypothetical protein
MRHDALSRAELADLSGSAVTPAPHLARPRACAGMRASRAHLDDVVERGDADRNRRERIGPTDAAATQLSVQIVSPTPRAAVATDRTRVPVARADLDRVVDADDGRRRQGGLVAAAVAYRTPAARAPAEHASARLSRARVTRAGRELHDCVEVRHAHGGGSIRSRSVSELTLASRTPARDGAALVTRTCVRASGGDGVHAGRRERPSGRRGDSRCGARAGSDQDDVGEDDRGSVHGAVPPELARAPQRSTNALVAADGVVHVRSTGNAKTSRSSSMQTHVAASQVIVRS